MAHASSKAKGFWGESLPNLAEKLMLVVSEVSEALEEVRSPEHDLTETYYKPDRPGKPEGLPIELADILIRVADLAEFLGIDLETAIRTKHSYNVTRPRKHGKLF